MRWLLFLVCLASCRGLYGVDNDRDAAGTHDGSAAHDAPTEDAPSDGTPDAARIHPIISGGSGDADGDGIDNAHDPCPLDPTPTGDMDGDGVGDVCDPHPDAPGDCVVLFDDFATSTNWATKGSMTFGCEPTFNNGVCVQADGDVALLLSTAPQPLFATATDALVIMHDHGNTQSLGFGIGARVHLDVQQRLVGSVCGAFRDVGGDGVAVEAVAAGVPTGTVTPFAGIFEVNVARRVKWRPNAGCTVDTDSIFANGDSDGDRVGVYLSDVKIDIRAIVAYGQHCAPAN